MKLPYDRIRIKNKLTAFQRHKIITLSRSVTDFCEFVCLVQSKYVEAIGILEELLKIKKVHFGTTSREFTRTCKQLCEICNILAVYYLKKEDINSALDLLKKSEELCENNELGQAMTFNNMACYYRRIGKMRTALNFLQRALTIESRLQRPEI